MKEIPTRKDLRIKKLEYILGEAIKQSELMTNVLKKFVEQKE